MTTIDVEPAALAEHCVRSPRPLLLALDVDGVLAPIVRRADQAQLLPGVAAVLAALGEVLTVAVVSGRSVDDLERQYGFPPSIAVVGSHGLETRDSPPLELTGDEQHRLDLLVGLAERARVAAGDGAWLEHKPASVVLHVREAPPATAEAAAMRLTERAAEVAGAHVKPGHSVVELMTRTTSKADAIAALRAVHGAATVVFAGDDHTDEEVFATLSPNDLAVRVGPGDTSAHYRLAGPEAVLAWLCELLAPFGAPAPS